jgi:hypothetical protein
MVSPGFSTGSGSPPSDELEHAVARRVEETCAAFFRAPQRAAGEVIPAWRRRTRGQRRWQVAACTAVAIGLQAAVPGRLGVLRPVWILPALQAILLLVLVLANPHRIDRQSRALRMLGLTLAALIIVANAWSVVTLATGLVRGTEGGNARRCWSPAESPYLPDRPRSAGFLPA